MNTSSDLLKVANAAYESHKIEKTAFLEHFSPEMIHSAVGLAKHVGLGAMAHIGSNAAIKAFRATKGNRIMQSLGELGIKHGLDGKQVHPFVMDRVRQLVGPEAIAEYTGSRNLASKALRKGNEVSGGLINANNAMAVIKHRDGQLATHVGREVAETGIKGYLGLKADTNLSSYPVLGGVYRSAKSFVNNGGQVTQHTGFGGKLINMGTRVLDKFTTHEGNVSGLANRKVRDVANAGFAAASMAVPGLGDHVAINTLRDVATRLPAGHGWVESRVLGGLNHEQPTKFFGKVGPKVTEGQGFLGKARRAMGDYLYSPTAWGEARDFGVKAKQDGFTRESIRKVIPLIGDFL